MVSWMTACCDTMSHLTGYHASLFTLASGIAVVSQLGYSLAFLASTSIANTTLILSPRQQSETLDLDFLERHTRIDAPLERRFDLYKVCLLTLAARGVDRHRTFVFLHPHPL